MTRPAPRLELALPADDDPGNPPPSGPRASVLAEVDLTPLPPSNDAAVGELLRRRVSIEDRVMVEVLAARFAAAWLSKKKKR